MLVLLTLLTQVALAKIECTASDHTGWSYTEWGKSGGARPGPDTVMASRDWSKAGTLVYRWERTYKEGNTTKGTHDWTWNQDATVKEEAKGSRMYGTQSYTTEVELWGPGHPRQTVPMSCIYTWARGIP